MYKITGMVYSFNASAALEEATLVKLGTAELDVAQATTNSDEVIGVTNIVAATGQSVAVQISGIARVKLGGTVAVGDRLTATTGGTAIATTTTGHKSFAIALRAGVSGEFVPVLLRRTTI